MFETQAAETAHEPEGESEGFFGKAMGYAGQAAERLHFPAELLAHQAAHQVNHLTAATQPFAESVMPGGLMGKLDPKMAEPWIEGLKESGRAGQVPTGPFNPSMAQWEEIAAADLGATEEAGEALLPAVSKASMLHNVTNGLGVVAGAGAAYEQYKESTCQTTAGKGVDATAAGLINFGVTKSPLALVDGAMGLAGAGLSWGGDKLGIGAMHDAGEFVKHNRPGHSLAAGFGGAVTAAEGMITGDSTGMEKWNKESLAGNHGMILQGFSQIGNVMANSKAMDKVFDWICD